MTQKSDFDQLKPQIEAIDNHEVETPYYPVGIYIQEAEDLFYWVQDDQESFRGMGFDMSLIESLPVRTGACSQAHSKWTSKMKTVDQAQEEWNRKAPDAYALRDRVLSACRYAYRKHPDLLSTVNLIAQGNGNADMIQDLNDLYVLGTDNPAPLEAIHFDMPLLNTCAETCDTMRQVRAAANGESKEVNEELETRNKAYTYLKMAVDEIREGGKYLFADNPERLKGYRSDYLHKQYEKKKSKVIDSDTII